MKKTRIISVICISLALLFFGIFYLGNNYNSSLKPFSSHETLKNTWDDYKKNTMRDDGRIIDIASAQGQNITTSEGQSYAMLRAVWLADKEAFDKTWLWTQQNLQQQNKLFSWLYGKRTDGSDGILTDKNGQNSASDADTDIAMALIFAYARWDEPKYLASAKEIINAIWDNEIIQINGMPYLLANNLEKNSSKPLINPSYLAPYAYRIFANVDRNHDWGKVVETSYQVLNESIYSKLDKEESASLPPNWVRINTVTGKIETPSQNSTNTSLDTNFGYDALRIPFRVALDKAWYDDPRANEVLYRLGFLAQEWKNQGFLFSVYSHDGNVIENTENPSMYGGVIGYFMATDKELADNIFEEKLQILYNTTTKTWEKPLPYYDDNWAWFGIALYYDQLPNLAKSLTL